MKNLILTIAIAFAALFITAKPAEAGLCCKKKEVCTVVVCKRTYCVEKCGLCCKRIVTYQETTYETTYRDCCGKTSKKTWTETKKIGVKKCCK